MGSIRSAPSCLQALSKEHAAVQEERIARQVARTALQQLNLMLEARRNSTRAILEATVIEALVRARPVSEPELEALQVSKFSANTRASYGSHILDALNQVWAL